MEQIPIMRRAPGGGGWGSPALRRFLAVAVPLACAVAITGCGADEAPASSSPDLVTHDQTSGGDASDADSTGSGGPGAAVSGRVALTGPVADGVVEAWSLGAALEPLEVVATATTADDGAFVLAVPAGVDGGWVEVRVSGTKASYAAGSRTEKLDWDDSLSTAVDVSAGKAVTKLSVNAWTTMAMHLARSYARKGATAGGAVTQARDRLRDHLWRPETHLIDRTAVVLPGEEGFEGAPAALGLTHLGLLAIADRWTESTGSPVKVVDVVTALARDLQNGLFDGLWPAADGSVVPVEVAGKKPVTADTTRWELASAIHALTADLDQAPLLATGALYEDLALDDGLLYPPYPVPHRFDPLAPTLEWQPPTPEPNTIVASAPQVRARIRDDGGVAEVWATVGTGEQVQPLSIDTVSADPGERVVAATVPLEGLPEGRGLVTLTAVDPDGNEGQLTLVLHVDRAAPTLTVVVPSQDATTSPVAAVSGQASDPQPADGLAAGVDTVEVLLGAEALAVAREGDAWSAVGTYTKPGTYTWTIRARDAVGNTVETTRDVLFDAVPPALTISQPVSGAWLTAPTLVASGLASDDGAGLAAVTVRVKGTADPVDAELLAGAWSAVLDGVADGDHALVVRAEDALGNPTELERPFGVDTAPPSLTVAPGVDGAWFATASVTLQGTATDATSGVATVRLVPSAGAPQELTPTPGTETWTAQLSLDQAGGATQIAVTARDVAGNESKTLQITANSDRTAPLVTITSPVEAQSWFNTPTIKVEGTATDLGAGVAKVAVQVNDAVPLPVTVVKLPEAGQWAWATTVSLTDAKGQPIQGKHTIRVRATDAAGNEGVEEERVILLDTVAPTIALGADSGYVPEDLCDPMVLGTVVKYTCPPVNADHVLGEACTPNCGVITKFPHRLGHDIAVWSTAQVKSSNIPYLVLVVDDAQSSVDGGSSKAEYRFTWPVQSGIPLEDWSAIPGTILPIAAPLFMSTTGIPDSSTVLPAGVQIRAVDAAGNVSNALSISFELKLTTPPLVVESLSAPLLLQSGAELSLNAGTAHAPFLAKPTPVRLGQVRLWNPYPIPLEISVLTPGYPGSRTNVTVSGARVYGAQTPLSATPLCASDACIYQATQYAGEAATGGGCSDLPSSAYSWNTELDKPAYSLRLRASSAGEAGPMPASVTLAAGGSVWLDVMASYASTCPMLDPIILSGYGVGPIYTRPDGVGCAAAKAHALDDRATCWYQEKCGFDCPVGGATPCSTCKKTAFVRPWLSLVGSVRFWTPGGNPVKLGISVAADGATPIPWTANQVPLIVDTTITSGTGDSEPFPHW